MKRFTRPETIRAFREHLGLTQMELAVLLGKSLNTIQRREQVGAAGDFRYTLAGLAVERGYDPWELGLLQKRGAAPDH